MEQIETLRPSLPSGSNVVPTENCPDSVSPALVPVVAGHTTRWKVSVPPRTRRGVWGERCTNEAVSTVAALLVLTPVRADRDKR